MFVKKLSINILTLYEMFYKGLRRGILIFYANTFKLLTSKHMRLQKGDSNMQFQLQFITDELPQTPVHINQRTAVRGVIHYQNKILMVQTNRGDYKFPGGGMEEGETEKRNIASGDHGGDRIHRYPYRGENRGKHLSRTLILRIRKVIFR